MDLEDIDVGATLSAFRHGPRDPTTLLRRAVSSGEFVHATITPEGPGTLRISWATDRIDVESFGAGGNWLERCAPAMLGRFDGGLVGVDTRRWDPLVVDALHRHRRVRIGASGNLYHELLPTILEQRITAAQALSQWRTLCYRLGEPAPGPFPHLRLPPAPEAIRTMPTWWFHPLGIEAKRARPLVDVARHASKYWSWADAGIAHCADKLALIPGVGHWTIGKVLGPALGDPDAVAVGDFHLKNLVGYALAGEPRATDDRMLELLEPYRGHRGRVIQALQRDGHSAPKFGPRQRIVSISRI